MVPAPILGNDRMKRPDLGDRLFGLSVSCIVGIDSKLHAKPRLHAHAESAMESHRCVDRDSTLFTPVGRAGQPLLKEALLALRSVLHERDIDAVPLYEGQDAALFIPLADAPPYEPVRAWLHGVVDTAIARIRRCSCASRARPSNTTSRASNAPLDRTRSADTAAYRMRSPATQISRWSRLSTGTSWTRSTTGQITAANAADCLAKGDLYASLAAPLAYERFADLK
jgi:hypothetical protein